MSPEGDTVMKRGMVKKFKAEHKHIVKVNKGGCWTLLLTGREKRQWGFWTKRKDGTFRFRKRNKYFYENGVHPCDS